MKPCPEDCGHLLSSHDEMGCRAEGCDCGVSGKEPTVKKHGSLIAATIETRSKCGLCGRTKAMVIDFQGRALMDDAQEVSLCFSDGICLAMSERQQRRVHARAQDMAAEIRYEQESRDRHGDSGDGDE